MANQDLIDQLEADKVRLSALIDSDKGNIENFNSAIVSYNEMIASLNDQIKQTEANIENLNTQIANDDRIIAYIPPES